MPRKALVPLLLLPALLAACPAVPGAAGDEAAMRRRMVTLIEDDVRETSRLIGRGVLDLRVMAVMGRVPRHEFVPRSLRDAAYDNRPLPIGYGQTISQPYIVALMTDLLRVGPGAVVLEIGTGSGYQAAVLAELVKKVYTVEIIPGLGREAAERLHRLGYGSVEVRVGDGYHGWEEHAPYDGIIVTAAASHVPPSLIRQLKPGARMVIPVGEPFMVQWLMLVEKAPGGEVTTRQILPVSFVPLTGAGRERD